MRVWYVRVRSGRRHDGPDEAADFSRRKVDPYAVDARRNLSGVCRRWYPVVPMLHRLFSAISRAVVNDEGAAGSALHPLVWSVGALPKVRRMVYAARDAALLLGAAPIWGSEWCVFFPRALLRIMVAAGRILLVFWSS